MWRLFPSDLLIEKMKPHFWESMETLLLDSAVSGIIMEYFIIENTMGIIDRVDPRMLEDWEYACLRCGRQSQGSCPSACFMI